MCQYLKYNDKIVNIFIYYYVCITLMTFIITLFCKSIALVIFIITLFCKRKKIAKLRASPAASPNFCLIFACLENEQ